MLSFNSQVKPYLEELDSILDGEDEEEETPEDNLVEEDREWSGDDVGEEMYIEFIHGELMAESDESDSEWM